MVTGKSGCQSSQKYTTKNTGMLTIVPVTLATHRMRIRGQTCWSQLPLAGKPLLWLGGCNGFMGDLNVNALATNATGKIIMINHKGTEDTETEQNPHG